MTDSTPAVRVCAATDLVDGGLGVKVPVTDGAGQASAFFVRYRGQVYGYLNRCAHVGVEPVSYTHLDVYKRHRAGIEDRHRGRRRCIDRPLAHEASALEPGG
ncbi:hypothetical protein L505_3215 [Bordetella bronchiseptica F4563]|nr:hypothetical protein L505_3215 [Bordetella bronchiseptica F4563]